MTPEWRDVVRTYLVHDSGAPVPGTSPLPGLRLERLDDCPPAFYLWLYRETGRAFQWIDRLTWDEARAAAYLAEPAREVLLLCDGPLPIGWAELGPAPDGAREVVYLGLLPWGLGRARGVGRWLLESVLAHAYAHGAAAVVLNTCTLDHPAALPNYRARGFRVVREETYRHPILPPA